MTEHIRNDIENGFAAIRARAQDLTLDVGLAQAGIASPSLRAGLRGRNLAICDDARDLAAEITALLGTTTDPEFVAWLKSAHERATKIADLVPHPR